MFNKNLKYYRLKNNLTKKALAEMVGITPMAISNYENGERRPDMPIIKKLADALGVKATDFLAIRNQNLNFCHQEFRKNSKLNNRQQEYIKESIEEYFNRFFEAIEILGGDVLPDYPEKGQVRLSSNVEENAIAMRKYLGISSTGPVGNLIELLENKGILVYVADIDNEGFSGINGSINGRPYIAVNKNMTPERMRTTIGHEIAHFLFKWPEGMNDADKELMATKISGAFLFSEVDAKRELGLHRSALKTDMYLVCKEYGIAMSLLVVRSRDCKIISENICKHYFIKLNQLGGKKKEKSLIAREEASLFSQLVYRAVNESEISIQKGAELLQIPYENVANNCCSIGV